ncbi:MAG TPA: MBL fold metallo-hydrolase [Stellaceae bacterium]|nr:MBL fold metallo-hydrolase [Stellaceae bacterium]
MIVRTSLGAAALVTAVALSAAFSHSALADPFVDPRADRIPAIETNAGFTGLPRDPACQAAKLVATGGAAPQSRYTLAVRWTGFANYEFAYAGHVILLDAYFDRGSNYPPLGFKAADVKKADVILLGHAHFDQMSDAASIALRTKAVVVGAPVTTDKLKTQGVPGSQIRTVIGRAEEKLFFDGFTVQPVLALHGQPDKRITEVMEGAINSLAPKPTPQQQAEEKAIQDRGTFDPRVIAEGTIAYIITFDDGFRIVYRDSGGHITEYEKAAFKNSPGVDLAIVALSADFLNPLVATQALEHERVYKPDVFMPAHHDAGFSGHTPLWRATEPVFQALKDADPLLVTASREYREPTCFDTQVNIARGRKRVAPP